MKKKHIFIGMSILILIILTIILFLLFRPNISKNEALESAYKYLGKTKNDFNYMKIKKDLSDFAYEIKLNDGNYNYEIEISIKNGNILEFEKTPISNLPNRNPNQTNYITNEEAKTKVLNYAKLKENEVIFTKIELETDNNIIVYEIEFIHNNKEYEYEINALTGEIIKFKTDKIY